MRHRKCGEKLVTVAMGTVRLPESWGAPQALQTAPCTSEQKHLEKKTSFVVSSLPRASLRCAMNILDTTGAPHAQPTLPCEPRHSQAAPPAPSCPSAPTHGANLWPGWSRSRTERCPSSSHWNFNWWFSKDSA